MSYSYGQCELFLGTAGNAFYNTLWQQAAAQGITVLLSSGDSGSAGCDAAGVQTSPPMDSASTDSAARPTTSPSAAQTSTCPTGGTAYWNTTNNASTQASVKGYIPESPWNESCTNPALATTNIFTGADAGTGLQQRHRRQLWTAQRGRRRGRSQRLHPLQRLLARQLQRGLSQALLADRHGSSRPMASATFPTSRSSPAPASSAPSTSSVSRAATPTASPAASPRPPTTSPATAAPRSPRPPSPASSRSSIKRPAAARATPTTSSTISPTSRPSPASPAIRQPAPCPLAASSTMSPPAPSPCRASSPAPTAPYTTSG